MSSLLSMICPAGKPLAADQAFQFSTTLIDPQTLVVQWKIAPGYHLYKERITFQTLPDSGIKIGMIQLPQGIPQHDDILGHYEIYEGNVSVTIPLIYKSRATNIHLKAIYQGCLGLTYCYPFETKEISLTIQGASQSPFSHYFDNNIFMTLLSFIGLGLLLSFTPCVFPMIPILSGIIVGQKNITTRRSFLLSLTYVLSMAITWAIAGMITAMAGHSVQAAMQNQWGIIAFSLLFVLLALSLFGLYELQLPAFLRNKANDLAHKQTTGTYTGVAIMGILSCLVISPCVSAPLVGILIYISTTGSLLIGGLSLLSLGLGMGIPLLMIGTMGGKLFIQAGPWINIIKIFFGILMLCMAGWMLSRIAPDTFFSHAGSDFIVVYNNDQLNQQLKKAQKENRPVMIDFYADWCVACKKLEKDTFQNERVKKVLSTFLTIRADVTDNTKASVAMEKRFSVFAPPTTVFLDNNSNFSPSNVIVGYVTPNDFLSSAPATTAHHDSTD